VHAQAPPSRIRLSSPCARCLRGEDRLSSSRLQLAACSLKLSRPPSTDSHRWTQMRRTRKATDQTPRPPLAPLSTPAGPSPTGSWVPAFLMRRHDFPFEPSGVRTRPRIARMPRMGRRGCRSAASPSVLRALRASVVKTVFVPPAWSLRLEALPTSIHRFTPMDTDEKTQRARSAIRIPCPCRVSSTPNTENLTPKTLPRFPWARGQFWTSVAIGNRKSQIRNAPDPQPPTPNTQHRSPSPLDPRPSPLVKSP